MPKESRSLAYFLKGAHLNARGDFYTLARRLEVPPSQSLPDMRQKFLECPLHGAQVEA
jgi:hypothetical protein